MKVRIVRRNMPLQCFPNRIVMRFFRPLVGKPIRGRAAVDSRGAFKPGPVRNSVCLPRGFGRSRDHPSIGDQQVDGQQHDNRGASMLC